MASSYINPEKILSHRLRGFASHEHTLEGLKLALASSAAFLEIDTRVSSDGRIYVYHDRHTNARVLGQKRVFSETTSAELDLLCYPTGEKLLPLEGFLETVAGSENEDVKICIDIKDFGYEKDHVDLVEEYDLSDRILWVSWIPQTLYELHKLDSSIPLILSHWNLIRFGWLGLFASGILGNRLLKVGGYVLIGKDNWGTHLGDYSRGFQHAYLSNELPADLLKVLSDSGGGVCVHTSVVDERLKTYCTSNNLMLMVFSVDDVKAYNELSLQSGIDVIFCDGQIGRELHAQTRQL